MLFQLFILIIVFSFTFGFHSSFRKTPRNVVTSSKMLSSDFGEFFIAAANVAEKSDDYVYGTVSAPDWVLPVGAFAVILTAAIPILLAPGEKALEEQRKNEEETKSGFGQGLNSGKKRSDRL